MPINTVLYDRYPVTVLSVSGTTRFLARLVACDHRKIPVGQAVRVLSPSESFTGTAERVTDSGALLVRRADGRLCEVPAGDVSVRGLMGYV